MDPEPMSRAEGEAVGASGAAAAATFRESTPQMNSERGFENVELGVIGKKKKVPRRVIHFVSGETMEEYSTDEDEVDGLEKKDVLPTVDPEKTGSNLFDLGHSNFLLDIPLEETIKAKMNYWDLIKIKSFCIAKETVNKTKRQLTEWEKIFANDIPDKRQNLLGARTYGFTCFELPHQPFQCVTFLERRLHLFWASAPPNINMPLMSITG
ncbi:protein FAM177A1 isoform X3 [Crocuta crocuta]